MTGLSVLFNLNTEEACYIYGNMDSYRRLNEQSRLERYSGGTTDRSSSYRDLRYVPSSELNSYSTHYTEQAPRYRSQYGLHTDSHRDLYHQSYPSVNTNFSPSVNTNLSHGVNTNLYPDGGSMSSYTRNYGVRNTNIDIATKSFDSSRLLDRKSPSDTHRPILDLGTDFRRRYHSDKTHDVAASSYRRDTGGDVSTTSPARSKSLRDHERHKEEPEETLHPTQRRQRLNSGDSVSSQTSERSEKGDNSKALFKAYQHRYKEHAEETTSKTPFSSWRRSGNFEGDYNPVESKSVDPERSRVEKKSRVFASTEDHSRHDHDKKDTKHERMKKFEKPERVEDVGSPKQQEGDKADELMFNFRQALRRHQISEERKASEERDSSKDAEKKGTAEMIEKIRAAKAQIKQLKESHIKSEDSKDIPTFHERKKLPSSSRVEEISDDKTVLKTVPKLARQKLVSDDLKAKYIESKKDEKVKEETVRPKEVESESKKHSRLKQKEHKESGKSEDAIIKISEPEQSKVVPDKKQYRKAIAEKFKKESSGFEFGTSFTTKPKLTDTKADQELISSDKTVEKSEQSELTDKITETATSVYKFVPKNKTVGKSEQSEQTDKITETATSVYKFVPKTAIKTSEESKDADFSHKPVSSLVYQEPSSKISFSEPYGVSYSPQSTSTQVLAYKSSKDKDTNQHENVSVESKVKDTDRKPRRQMKKHTKAKSFELGLLSKPKEKETEVLETQDDSSVIPKLSTDELSRKERIDKYKEERKKQLATIFVGGESELPSLFLSSRPETETALSRSHSLKVDSDTKPDIAIAPVRSKSMKEASPAHVSKISGLQLAEIGSQSKDAYEKQSKDEIAKQTAKVASTKDQKDSKEITHRTMLAEMVLAEDREHALKSSFEKETDSGHESADSSKRIKRRLPSLEDVLGTNVVENRNYEKKPEVKQQYSDLKKPKETETVKPPADFSLDYSKVKITPKSIPVEMSQGRVISKKFDIIQPQEEIYNGFSRSDRDTYQALESDRRKDLDENAAEASFEELERSIDQKDEPSELIESEIPKDAVSKMSKYFMNSENQGRPESMAFASVYSKQKTEADIKPFNEAVRKYPSEEISDEHYKKDTDVSEKEMPVPEKAVISEEFNKQSERRSGTPERVISVSEARKVFSESTTQQVFGTDYVHKDKEPEKTIPSKYTTAVAEIDSVFKDTETELTRQMLLGVRSSSAELSDSVIDRTHASQSQQRSGQHHKVPTKEETIGVSAAKPPVSPRMERKRATDTKFGKISYRSSESDESKFDMVKERERSKSREISKEKEIQKRITTKERSPILESIPKADVRIRHTVKERSPSVESIPQTGITKISYRDIERARHEKSLKFGQDSSAQQEHLVFGSDYRKPITKPDSMSYKDDYLKPKSEAITEESSETIQSVSDYDRHKTETDTKSKEDKHDKIAIGRDLKKFQIGSDVKHGSEAMIFGSDFRKPKTGIKPEVKPTREDDKIHDNIQTDQTKGQFKQSTFVLQPIVHETDRAEMIKKRDTEEKMITSNVQARSVSKEEKTPVLKPAEAKVDIKAEAVSAASGQVIEVPVSPRQKSPPKVVSLSKQETVPKIEVKPEIKLISKPKVDEKVHKTAAQISSERQISEPSESQKSEKQIQDIKPSVLPSDMKTSQMIRSTETTDKVKPVQYVAPSPLLAFSAKTETTKKIGITETKVSSQVEKKTEVVSPAEKEIKPDRVRESDKEFISKRAKEEEWKKPVDTTSEFHKKTVEKMLLDTSLDDILSRNADYLSDSEKTSGSGRGRAEKKTRPQSVHEESRSHGRTKRIFKKKNLQRSKSEDRTHFKVDASGAVRRSKGTEDIEKTHKQGAGGVSRNQDTRESGEQHKTKSQKMEWSINRVTKLLHLKEKHRTLQGEATSTDTDSTSSERISRFDSRRKPKSEGSVEKVLAKSSVIEDKSRTSPNETAGDKVRSVPNDSQTGCNGTDEVFSKIGENVENQTGVSYREQKSSDRDFSDTVSDRVTHSSMELLSASDTSDLPDRRQHDILSGDGKGDNEVYNRLATPESDLSAASSSVSEGARKRRKDKSSLRKSKLNESSDDSVTRRRDDSSRMNKIGVRRVSSSRLARESRDDKYKEEADRRAQESEKLTTKHESSLNWRNGNVNQSNSLSSAQDKSLNNLDQITSHSRVIHSSVLDSKTVLPSRFALPSKVSSAISKLSEASDRTNIEGSVGPKDEKTPSPRGFRRGNKFSELLQKFSSSEASGSERSDTDSKSHVRKPFLTRQEAYAVSSSTSSEETRRTPERTQSLRLRGSRSAAVEQEGAAVQRSSSFKSDFMKRRFSPEPEQRRRLPETPVSSKQETKVPLADYANKPDENVSEQLDKSQKHVAEQLEKTQKPILEQSDKLHKPVLEQSDKPSPELAHVLSKRSEIVQKQQETGEVHERKKIHDGKVEKADSFSPATVDEVIIDSEVVKMLRTRRKETDSSVESVSDKDTKSQQSDIHIHPQSKVETEKLKSRSQTPDKSQIKTEIPQPKSQSSFENRTSVQITSKRTKTEDLTVSVQDKTKGTDTAVTTTVPKLDLTSIDKSLAVLEHVTHELEEPDVDLKDEKEQKLHDALSNVHVDKQSEVAQFINSVEGDNLNASHIVIQPKVSDTQLNVDIGKVEKERTIENISNNAIHDKENEVLDSKKEIEVKEVRHGKDIAKESPEQDIKVESKQKSESGTVDITNITEIKRKFTRDKTPERQPPIRSGPMKVMSHVKVSAALTRTESVGRSESERPKGILKRTPSLHKSGVNVDPELASILKNRRAKHEDVEEEAMTQKLTAQEEIKQSRESQPGQEDNGVGQNVSVAERIFQMHSKIEEVRSCPITPKTRSGFTTPKSALNRSGTITPKSQFSFDEPSTSKAAPVSGPQLIERLSSLEGQQSAVRDRRKKYQQGRRQDDWRTRTLPVTLLEIQEADSLETVRKFRSEILHKASTSIFENLQKEEKFCGKKTEYPQPFRKDRRPRGLRHKTLPVTAAELNAVPEDQIAETMNSLKKKFEAFGARDSKADSGILSGSEVDVTDRESDHLKNLNDSISEDDPVKLSVSAKASIFHQLEEKSKERADKKSSASGAKRYIDRKKRERSRTQPITEEEVHTAAVKADEENAEDKDMKTDIASERDELPDEGQGDTDELSRQSLADKVKLFKQIEEKDKTVPKKAPPPPPKRRNRKLASRFATQPVTYEEVEKAAKISPLAMSLVKPPDPEMLAGMSVKAQREIMAEHAQKCLSQPGSRSSSRPVSRATSVGDLSGKPDNKGTSKSDSDSKIDTATKGVLKDNFKSTDTIVKGIQKMDNEKTELASDRKGLLKSQELPAETDEEVRSILKLDDTSSARSESEKSSRNTLKQQLEEKLTLHLKGESKVKGLLKAADSDSVRTTSEITSVLKKESVIETNRAPEPKGILKKEGSFEQRSGEPDKVVPEKPKVEDISEQGGLSDDSLDNLDSDDNILSHSPTPEDDKTVEPKDAPVRRSSKSRRRFNRDRKLEAERYHTQPAEVKQDQDGSESPTRRKNVYAGRHLTQPITPTEKRQAEVATEMPEIQKTGSITDRLNALKKSGDEEWRKRVSKPGDLDTITPTKTPPQVKMREKKGVDLPRPSSIADRLTLLDSAQEGWRGRVGETDVKKFTIEHKLTASGQGQGESPLVARLRQKPKRDLSRESDTSETSDLPSPVTPTKESSKIPLPREVICTDLPAELEDSQNRPTTLATIKSMEEEEEKKGPVNVEIPQIGQEIEEFFQTNRDSVLSETGLNFDVDDFNELFLSANDILSSTRKIRPKRRHTATSRNPLKTMSMCLEVKSEYTEVITGVAEKELKRIQTAKIAKGSGFAIEALAGLASKENFSKIELRKTESTGSGSGNTRHDPYLPLMLIHIKGRRKVQCRLVEPSASSLNSGDCFIVVTPDKIVQWLGDYCNVIEKAKAADVADFVKVKRDLGCKALGVATVEEKKALMGSGKQFFSLIGGLKDYMNCGPQEEDELYENHIVETNMVYKLEKNKLVPVEEYWGNQPKYEMLKPDQVFVFDFGSELYIWQGKSVTPAQRKIGLKLAEQLWEKGYDYSSCDVNPLCPLKTEHEGGLPMSADSRPDWALFGKVNQNMETILFREKFADWPDTSRFIKVKGQEEVSSSKFDIADLKPYDAKLMVPVNNSPVSLKLEGSHVGRGNKWEEDMEGFMREQNIETMKVVVWHVLEYDHFQVEEHSYGQFHEGDTYVIRWSYMIINAGMRSLKGEASRHTHLGRERCAYFFWQGKTSTINEKGASALMTVELDEERGPQVLVEEGKEPACFLNLFKGRMIIHIGKREEESTNTQGNWRFYCLRNEYENEMCLIEVPTEISSLRSVSSFLLLNVKTGALTVWHGCKSPDHTKKLALKAAENLKQRCPLEVGLHKNVSLSITEVDEGHERTDFWRTMNVHLRDRSLYCSLLNNPESFSHTLRLFHMTSVSGVFDVHEIINPSRSPDLPTKFPVLQTDLYKVSQPGLFLVDNGHEVYLWQGWWPEGDENQGNVLTGSAQTRFTADRRCAMETTLHYCKEINPDSPPSAFVVYAGLEPLQFTNLFPFWTVDERVREINLKEGKQDSELVPVEELLKKVTKTRFTLAELQEPTLPEGVDPLKLESYLSDEEFQELFSMDKEEFYALPGWKQQNVKQKAGLF